MLISVIVPVYNAEQYVEACVRSIVEQHYQELEIILVNDGSTDGSEKIIRTQFGTLENVKYLWKENGGVSSARNLGIEHATGDFITFIDSDDLIDPDFIGNMVACIGDCDTVIGSYVVDTLERGKNYYYDPSFERISDMGTFAKHMKELVDKRLILSPFAKLYRTQIIREHGIRFQKDIRIGEDLLFNLSYFSHTVRIAACKGTYYHYMMRNPNSLSRNFGRERIANTNYLFKRSYQFAKHAGYMGLLMPPFAKYYFKSQMILIESLTDAGDVYHEVIEEILNSSYTKVALKFADHKDPELMLYRRIFAMKSKRMIQMVAGMRVFIKKKIRGY